jgi:hypothetical protein
MARPCILFGRIALTVAAILGGTTLSASTPAHADGWSPGLTVGGRLDRPVSGITGDGGEWTGSLTPQFFSDRVGPYTRWDFQAHRRYDASQRLSGLRAAHDVALGTLSSQLAEHTLVTVDGAYFRSRDVLNPDPEAPFTASDQSRASGEGSIETWRAQAGAQVEGTAFKAPGFADARSRSWNVALFPMRSEQNRWLVGLRREDWMVAGRNELASSAATVGVRRHHTPFVSSELEVGVVRIADDLAGPPSDELAVAAALNGIGHALDLPFEMRFRVRRGVTTTGLAEISRPMGGARAGLLWERSLHAAGGVFQEPTHRDLVTFDVQDTVGSHSILSIEGSYRRERPRSAFQNRLETWRGSASLSRDLRPWLRGKARYSVAQQNAAPGVPIADFDRNRLELSLSAVYQ